MLIMWRDMFASSRLFAKFADQEQWIEISLTYYWKAFI